MTIAVLIFCSSPLFSLVLQSENFILCFSNSAGTLRHKGSASLSPSQMPLPPSPFRIKIMHSSILSLCKLFPSGMRWWYVALEGTQISELGTGDTLQLYLQWGSDVVQTVQEFRKKSTKNLLIIFRKCVCTLLVV